MINTAYKPHTVSFGDIVKEGLLAAGVAFYRTLHADASSSTARAAIVNTFPSLDRGSSILSSLHAAR